MPTERSADDHLRALVASFLADAARLGFGTDDQISGADTVDLVNKYYDDLRALVNGKDERERLRALANLMLSMLNDLNADWPWEELAANIDDVRAEARDLRLGEPS